MATPTQYKVTWFPPDAQKKSATTFDEARATELFEEAKMMGFYPVLESRIIPEWDVVRDAGTELRRP